jgi:opacity protein-like surface antigen
LRDDRRRISWLTPELEDEMSALFIGAGCVASLALAIPALAQTAPRGYVQGTAGMSFVTETSAVFAGGGGVRVGSFEITGEVGHMRNVLPKSVQTEANALADELQTQTGFAVSVDARATALYATGGLRWVAPTSGRAHPYLGVSAGMAHVTPHVRATVEGVSAGEFGTDQSVTKPLLGVGGGMTVDVGRRLGVDLGYQYNRIFTPDPAVNTSRIAAAFLVRF